MKELRWKPIEDFYGWHIYDEKEKMILTKNMQIINYDIYKEEYKNIYFNDLRAAKEFLYKKVKVYPDIMYREVEDPTTTTNNDSIVDDEFILNLREECINSVAYTIVKNLICAHIEFSRHDVVRIIRQIVGPNIEIEYYDWKGSIIAAIDSLSKDYDYIKQYNDGYISYKKNVVISNDGLDNNDIIEDDIINNINTDITDEDVDKIKVTKTTKQHVITKAEVINAGGYPGAMMLIWVCDGQILFNIDLVNMYLKWKFAKFPKVFIKKYLRVDKNCNLRLSKYMFDMANISYLFRNYLLDD